MAAGQTLGGSVWVKSSGLAGSGTLALVIAECDASGAFLRVGTLASVVGNQAGWVQLAGTYVTGANCAWVDIRCRAVDATSASANAIIWFDNAQLWNQTTTGMLSMPWCDLRSFGSPAQLVVSGLLGDLPAPAMLSVGAYLASFAPASFLSLYVGRKGLTSPNAYLVGPSFAAFAAAFSPAATAVLDPSAFAGFTNSASVPSGGWNPRFTSPTAADAPGVYHVLTRFKTAQSPGNIPNINVRVSLTQQVDAWLNNILGSDVVGQWNGPFLSPSPALTQNVWGIEDAGQIILPPFPIGAMTDPSVLFLVPRAQWTDASGGGGAAANIDWSALLPVDGSLLVATLNNPSNGANTYVTSWLWMYGDGLLLNRAGAQDGPAWLWSLEAGPTSNPAKGAGGAGTQNTGAVNVNSGADPALILDPTQNGANGIDGVNQLVAVISDQAGEVLPLFAEVVYSPLYLEPR